MPYFKIINPELPGAPRIVVQKELNRRKLINARKLALHHLFDIERYLMPLTVINQRLGLRDLDATATITHRSP